MTERALLERMGLPEAVRTAATACLKAGDAAAPAPLTAAREPAPGWHLRPDAAGGWLLLESAPGGAGPRPWAAGDRCGALHLAAGWAGVALREAWLALPAAGWLALRPEAETHPLWGAADALVHHPEGPEEAGTPVGRLPALDYGALSFLPPFDRPSALPPGAGSAVLNLLALLCALQGRETVHYRGPYPTPALFASLCRSFVPEGEPAQALAAFTAHETALAFRGRAAENPVRWRPAPFAPCRVAEALLLHLRAGVETAWVHGVPFRRAEPGPGGALPAGERVWREGAGDDATCAVGLALLGRPYARLYRLAADGTPLQATREEAPAGACSAEPPPEGPALDGHWRAALFAWSTLRAHAGLAAAVAGLEDGLPVHWAPLPLRLAGLEGGVLRVQAALATEYRRRMADEDPAALAMMMVSDVLEAAAPHLLRHAQRRLEIEREASLAAGRSPSDPGAEATALLRAGEAAQARARERLDGALPKLVQALAAGEALPE